MTTSPVTRAHRSRPQPTKMSEVVARALLDHIVGADLRPGDPLPNERDAIAWLGVSRGSLREGLRLLEAHGVISVRPGPGGGPVVRQADPEAFAGMSTLLMQFLRVPFHEVLDTRIAFEPQVAEAAARARTGQEADDLVAEGAEMSSTVADPAAFQATYDRFHRRLAEATHNRVLLLSGLTFRKIWEPIHAEVGHGPEALARTVAAHRRLARAVLDRDADAARATSRRHLAEYRAHLRAHHPDLLDRRVAWATDHPGGGSMTSPKAAGTAR